MKKAKIFKVWMQYTPVLEKKLPAGVNRKWKVLFMSTPSTLPVNEDDKPYTITISPGHPRRKKGKRK